NISDELAKKIWSVTSGDVALGIRKFPGEKLPYVPSDLESILRPEPVTGGENGGNGIGSKIHANDNATAHILEVGRALYGDPYGFPEIDTPNYYKAAENYSLFGDYFLDFPKDTATCFADLDQATNGDSHTPPGLEKIGLPVDRNQVQTNGGVAATATASGSQYPGPTCSTALPQQQQQQQQQQQRQATRPVQHSQAGNEMTIPQMYQFNQLGPHPHHPSCPHMHGSHVHPPQSPVGSAAHSAMAAALQHQKQHRPGGALMSGAEMGGVGLCGHNHVHYHGHNHNHAHAHAHAPANELNLSQLYQQLMARNMRPNPLQTHQHMAQNQHQHQHHHHHTTTCAAAAAAMIYANFEQQIRQFQLQQQQQQQQQQRHARIPRGIYGGNG
ncbi:hypothetical protein KR200_011721, partial [Drosophila serrata]